MEDNFKLYSKYYDLLYYDKDYEGEANYICDLIDLFRPNSNSILELGSGTGKHANILANKGYKITGIEKSSEMVDIAKTRPHPCVNYHLGDVSEFNLDTKYDVATSLFHVVSYLTESATLISAFENINRHLNQDGLFIFDVWHSPAVYSQRPEKRVKFLENDAIHVARSANPNFISEKNIVEVKYQIEIKNKITSEVSKIEESHPMRFFSRPEMEILAHATGFEIIHNEEFLTKEVPSDTTWGVCYILRRKNPQ